MTAAGRQPMSRRERLMWLYRVLGPAGALAIAIVTLLLFRSPRTAPYAEPARFAALLGMTMVIMGWSLCFAWLTARQEDEYTLSAAKYAWFWGGLIGLGCSVPVLAFLAWRGLTMLDPADFRPSRATAQALIFGYMLSVLFQMFGFLVARVWWARGRR